MKSMRKTIAVASIAGAFLAGGLAAPAHAQVQDGLINVAVGDVTILEDVRIGVAANVAAQICGVKVGPLAILGRAVDRTGTADTVCTSRQGDPVIFSDN